MPDPSHLEITRALLGEGEGSRWTRYFQIMDTGWERALFELKQHVEAGP